MHRFQFITAVPWEVTRGTGCYVGTRTLIEGLRGLGVRVDTVTPEIQTPVYTLTRVLFNESLRWRRFDSDATIGIDLDGYGVGRRPGGPPHIACIKGVLGDAVRFESGPSRASLELQSWLEARNARRADLVVTISQYCASRIEELYGVKGAVVVPEVIDLERWHRTFEANPAEPDPGKFTVLCVCRFYPRKRLEVLLQAAALLLKSIPELEVRIVGNGPELRRLTEISDTLQLGRVVQWLGNLGLNALAREYNRSDMFCLPSVQEGFGIVFLEAMAAGKPIVAVRAGAVPEVVQDGLLAEPDSPESLAEAIGRLHRNRELRAQLSTAGLRNVKQFEVGRVAQQFLNALRPYLRAAPPPF